MEASGAASNKSDAQHASKDDDFHMMFNAFDKQYDFLKEISFSDPLKQGIWGLNECYDDVSTPKSTICHPKEACETPTKGDGGLERNTIGASKGVSYKRGPWTKAEDGILRKVVEKFGPNDWVKIEMQSGLDRTSKSCRLRWKNHLQPNLKKGSFSCKEERDVIKMHYRYGNKWSLMAKRLPGRSDNEIKNLWHSRIKKCKKRGVPLYPEWCLEEDQTSNDGEVCRKRDDEKMVAAESLADNHVTQSCTYYSPAASTNDPLMIKPSPFIKSPATEFRFPESNAQTALHPEDSSFTQSTQASHPEVFPSFQHFLSPRPKTSLACSSTFSASVAPTPYQQQYNQLGNFNNAPTFETFQCPPLISSPASRFKRFPQAVLSPLLKPTEVPYSNPPVTETPTPPLSLSMSSSNQAISEKNTHLLDALLKDAQVDSCLSDIQFVEQCLLSQQFNAPQNLYEKILRRKEYNSIREASLGRNLSSGQVPLNGSLLKSMDFLGKSQQMRENYSNKVFEGSGGSLRSQLLGYERLRRACLQKKGKLDFEDDKCYSRIPNIQSDIAPVEDLGRYSFDFPLGDTTAEALSLDGICESSLFHAHHSAPDLIGYNPNGVLCGSTELLNERLEMQKPSSRSLNENNEFDIEMKSLTGEYSMKDNISIIDVNDEKPSQGSHNGA